MWTKSWSDNWLTLHSIHKVNIDQIFVPHLLYYMLNVIFVTLFGKTGLNENSVVMHFKCVDNGSQRICNVIQSIVKTLTMFNKMFKNG